MDDFLYRPGWPEAANRLEAWWRGETFDRPVMQITARKEPKASRGRAKSRDPLDNDELLRRWTDPEVV
ncbi:MAG: hypothetical protein QGD94_07350, partial [Planctomycetia bacterium]|nr:hypothetical protein [Planctomycetia bacterium]